MRDKAEIQRLVALRGVGFRSRLRTARVLSNFDEVMNIRSGIGMKPKMILNPHLESYHAKDVCKRSMFSKAVKIMNPCFGCRV